MWVKDETSWILVIDGMNNIPQIIALEVLKYTLAST